MAKFTVRSVKHANACAQWVLDNSKQIEQRHRQTSPYSISKFLDPEDLDFLRNAQTFPKMSGKQKGKLGILVKRCADLLGYSWERRKLLDQIIDDYQNNLDVETKPDQTIFKVSLIAKVSRLRKLSPGRLALFIVLIDRTHQKTDKVIRISIKQLADQAGLKDRAVAYYLNYFEEEGIIQRERSPGGQRQFTKYHGVIAGTIAWLERVEAAKTTPNDTETTPNDTETTPNDNDIPAAEEELSDDPTVHSSGNNYARTMHSSRHNYARSMHTYTTSESDTTSYLRDHTQTSAEEAPVADRSLSLLKEEQDKSVLKRPRVRLEDFPPAKETQVPQDLEVEQKHFVQEILKNSPQEKTDPVSRVKLEEDTKSNPPQQKADPPLDEWAKTMMNALRGRGRPRDDGTAAPRPPRMRDI